MDSPGVHISDSSRRSNTFRHLLFCGQQLSSGQLSTLQIYCICFVLVIMARDKDMNSGPPALLAHTMTIEEAQVQLETDLEGGLASCQIPPRAEKWGGLRLWLQLLYYIALLLSLA